MASAGVLALVGSPADVATFAAVLFLYRERVAPNMDVVAAATVIMARDSPAVDDERVADELDVDESELDDVRPVMAHGPVSEDGSQND